MILLESERFLGEFSKYIIYSPILFSGKFNVSPIIFQSVDYKFELTDLYKWIDKQNKTVTSFFIDLDYCACQRLGFQQSSGLKEYVSLHLILAMGNKVESLQSITIVVMI